jgi:hypothetical protein
MIMTSDQTLSDRWTDWLATDAPQRLVSATIMEYRRQLRLFVEWGATTLAVDPAADSITPYRVNQYLQQLKFPGPATRAPVSDLQQSCGGVNIIRDLACSHGPGGSQSSVGGMDHPRTARAGQSPPLIGGSTKINHRNVIIIRPSMSISKGCTPNVASFSPMPTP